MVKKYGDLYQDTRRALLATENAQDAGVLARMLVCHVSGKSQADFLDQIGCTRLQGYLFGKPIPKDALYERIDNGELVVSEKHL